MRDMKDSGIAWIGEIPGSWDISPLKYNYTLIAGATPESSDADNWDGDIAWITPADYKTKDVYVSGGARTLSERGYESCSTSLLPIGSIIFSKRAPIGSVAVSTAPLCTNQGCLGLVNRNETVNNKYFYYVLSIYPEIFNLYGSGTTFKEISANVFANIKLPYPSFKVQKTIADFLDEKCAEIDALTADIHTQIDTLEQYKRSVITETVTKGLDPHAEMKDSGIEFIGVIPAKWKTIRVKYLGIARNGLTYSPSDICDEKEGILVLRSSNVQNGKISLSDNVYVSCNVDKSLMVRNGDILICSRNGSPELVGKNAIIPQNTTATFGAFMMVFRCDCPQYMYYILNSSIFSYYLGSFRTSTINQLTGRNFGNIVIPFSMDKNEQKNIVEFLDKKCSEIEEIIADKKEQLTTLADYKKSLIFEYVTGKKEVPAV